MSEMIERVAEAIKKAIDGPDVLRDASEGRFGEHLARAAIEAMRFPHEHVFLQDINKTVFNSVIDAALAD